MWIWLFCKRIVWNIKIFKNKRKLFHILVSLIHQTIICIYCYKLLYKLLYISIKEGVKRKCNIITGISARDVEGRFWYATLIRNRRKTVCPQLMHPMDLILPWSCEPKIVGVGWLHIHGRESLIYLRTQNHQQMERL